MDEPGPGDVFRFEGFRFDRAAGCLYRVDSSDVSEFVPLGLRALALLAYLVERQGELVSKDEIMKAVWHGGVVEEANLTVQISALRRVLDRDREQGSCIQTISGRGYRFVSAVLRTATPSGRVSESSTGATLSLPDKPSIAIAPVIAQAASTPKPAPRLSIVVLPFANLSNDPEQQYFADGITEDLTTDLSRIEGSFVISRSTAFTYKDKPVDTKQIGHELSVRYVLEGSVRRSGKQLRVNAQLIDAESGGHLWAERFDRDTSDLLALQREITGRIAATLSLELVSAEATRPTDNPEVLDYCFRARAALHKGPGRDSFAEAISLFEHALAQNPRPVEALAGLAQILAGRVMNGLADCPAADLDRAERLIAQVSAISPLSQHTYLAKGHWFKAAARYEEAIPEYEMVITLNPNSVLGLACLGQCKLFTGSIDEAIALHKQVIRLSPRDPFNGNRYWTIGYAHLLLSRVDEAIVWLEKGRNLSPRVAYTHASLASAYALNGEIERAAAELVEARRLSPGGMYSSITQFKAGPHFSNCAPKVRALCETTLFAGLRKAGMPEQ